MRSGVGESGEICQQAPNSHRRARAAATLSFDSIFDFRRLIFGGSWPDGQQIPFISYTKMKSRLDGRILSTASMKPTFIPSQYYVRATIAALLRQGDASLQHTARRLGISPRSLQRHLTGMGTSYSEMVAEVRLDTACHLLAESRQSISSIASRLGYSEASSFSRTFLRLMKIQPIVYRRQQIAQGNGRGGDDSNRSVRPDKPDMAE